MIDNRFISQEELMGDNSLNVFNINGKGVRVSDAAIIQGVLAVDPYLIHDDDLLDMRTCPYYISNGGVVTADGNQVKLPKSKTQPENERAGLLCIMDLPKDPNVSANGGNGGVYKIQYGYSVDKAASKELQEELNKAYNLGTLQLSNNKFMTLREEDSIDTNEESKYCYQPLEEYIYNGKRYVRMIANYSDYNNEKILLSNGELYQKGDIIWVEVLPHEYFYSKEREKDIIVDAKVYYGGISNFAFAEKFLKKYYNTNLLQGAKTEKLNPRRY